MYSAINSDPVVVPVVLAGGAGTRLWPLSRSGFPKQFLTLFGNQSLFQLACQRVLCDSLPIVVTNEEHRFLVSEQLREISLSEASMLLEPVAKNTAPAMTLAALFASESDQDPVLVVMPADQTVKKLEDFRKAIDLAIKSAAAGELVVLGVTPDSAHTGYGYIKESKSKSGVVESFVEKPDKDSALQYLEQGGYYWNAGIFVVKASVWMKALEKFCPEIKTATKRAFDSRKSDRNFIRPDNVLFEAIPAESIDYAVIEYCPGSEIPVRVIPVDVGWTDLGSWEAVSAIADVDAFGNSTVGDTFIADGANNYVNAGGRFVSVVGLDNIVVVETADAVLVADKSKSQAVKQVVDYLKRHSREESLLHRKALRPWGWYDCLDKADRFKVKRIQVNPGASLSLQQHHHRAEHWIVVRGTAEVTRGDEVLLLTENQSTYIPLCKKHRLSNPGNIPLEIIEVQSGSYLGEDDIIRFIDEYGR